jgi:hypothetical protein
MDLEDAFCAVEHLASRHRLLIGRGYRASEGDDGAPLDIEWSAGDIRDIHKLRGLEFVSEVGPQLMKIFDEHAAGKTNAVTSITWTDAVVTFIVLGAESPEQVAETLRAGAEEMISRSLRGYLSERFSDWKRPLARILPFPRRSKD